MDSTQPRPPSARAAPEAGRHHRSVTVSKTQRVNYEVNGVLWQGKVTAMARALYPRLSGGMHAHPALSNAQEIVDGVPDNLAKYGVLAI